MTSSFRSNYYVIVSFIKLISYKDKVAYLKGENIGYIYAFVFHDDHHPLDFGGIA